MHHSKSVLCSTLLIIDNMQVLRYNNKCMNDMHWERLHK
jgi:hypothetical protein